jgi:hypothetical protein
MKEFDLNKVSEGDEVPCRDGKHKGKIIFFLKGKILVRLYGPDVDDVLKYDLNGKNEFSTGNDFGHDLMLPDDEVTKYVAIFKHKDNGLVHACNDLFESIEIATKSQEYLAYANWQLIKIQPVTGV